MKDKNPRDQNNQNTMNEKIPPQIHMQLKLEHRESRSARLKGLKQDNLQDGHDSIYKHPLGCFAPTILEQ